MSPPCHLTIWRRSAYGLCHFAVWLESLRRFGSVASLPIESRPCFPRMASQRSGSSSPSSGDPYNSEKAGASCWLPRTWHTDSNFGPYVQKTLHLGALVHATQDGQSEYARDERSGLSPLPVALQLCRGADPSPNTRPARSALSQHAVTLPALRFASHSIAPQTASACPGTFQHFFWYFWPVWKYAPGQAYWNHTGKDGIIHGILESRRNKSAPSTAHFAVWTWSSDRVNMCAKSRAVFRGGNAVLRQQVQEGLF